jgi:mannose-6-phosphate isomerase-like protein (cupin superfamily)
MSTAFRPCTVADSGWKPDDPQTMLNFHGEGAELAVELRLWTRRDIAQIAPPPGLGEEMAAVLSGRFELVCDDERYQLAAGDGLLIPTGASRSWRLQTETGVLYRVYLST